MIFFVKNFPCDFNKKKNLKLRRMSLESQLIEDGDFLVNLFELNY